MGINCRQEAAHNQVLQVNTAQREIIAMLSTSNAQGLNDRKGCVLQMLYEVSWPRLRSQCDESCCRERGSITLQTEPNKISSDMPPMTKGS